MTRDGGDVTHRKRGMIFEKVSELSSALEDDGWLSLARRGLVEGVARSLGEMEKSV